MEQSQKQKHEIASYAKSDARNHLVFVSDSIPGIKDWDMGRMLASWLREEGRDSTFFRMELEDYLNDILSDKDRDEELGSYLMLSNIGILFEPELQLNVRQLWENSSRDKTLIIKSQGEIVDKTFFFLTKEDKYHVDLSGLLFFFELNTVNEWNTETLSNLNLSQKS